MDMHLVWKEFVEKGDEHLFSILYDKLANQLFSYGICLGFSEEHCQDALQDVFCKMYLSKNRMSHITNISAYLFKAYKHRLIDMYRKSSKTEELDATSHVFPVKATVLEQIMKEEKTAKLEITLNTLPQQLTDKQRRVVYMKYMHGMNYVEIGEELNLHPDSCKKMVYRAIEKLRRIVKIKKE